MISITLPLRTVSESNARGHWSLKAKRTRLVRNAVALGLPEIAYVWRSSGEREKHLLVMCPRCPYVSMVSTADEGRSLLAQHAWEEHG